MTQQYIREFFIHSPIAYTFFKPIMTNNGSLCDYQFIELNPAYEKLMDVEGKNIKNKRFYDVFPTGWKGEEQWKDIFHEAITHQKIARFIMHHYSIQKWIEVLMFPINENVFACIFNDVTKEYMLDKEIEGFLKVNLDMLCVASTEGKFIKVNKQFEHVLGYTREELEDQDFYFLVHKDDIPTSLETMNDLKQQKSIKSFINRVLCKNGSYKYLEWRSQPNGKYIYSSARDITNKILNELKLIELTENLQKKNEKLETLAITDELTGLYNRHFIDHWIEEEMAIADRYQNPITMIIFDLDHFKKVNDKWGHPIGDEVLKEVAEITQNHIRKSDVLARMGGEEFAIFLPHCPSKNAYVVAEKIRILFEQTDFPLVRSLTASFGVSERKIGEPFLSWYKRADNALYDAKKSGRNQVICSDDLEYTPIAFVNIQWKPEWECGHSEIDDQHKELVKQGNILIHLSLSNADYERTMKQLNLVLEHVVYHFDSEVQILEALGYPNSLEHKKIHDSLVEKAVKLKEAYQSGEHKSSSFFSFIIDDIIVGHMLKEDNKYFAFIQDTFLKNVGIENSNI